MKKYISHIVLFFIGSSFLSSCQMNTQEIPTNQHEKIPIITTNETLGIHTKMISGNHAFIVTVDNQKKTFSSADRELIYNSDIIIGDTTPEKSTMAQILQKYTGTYLNTGNDGKIQQAPYKKDEIMKQIIAIRDTLAEINPSNKGEYFDNAGNYIHLLDDTYAKLNDRLKAYNQSMFITVGQDLDNFLNDFGLKKYHGGHVSVEGKSKNDVINEIDTLLKTKKVGIVFVSPRVQKDIIQEIKEKPGIQLYVLNNLTEDTSSWGYIRYTEKMVNTFVSAFDTYD